MNSIWLRSYPARAQSALFILTMLLQRSPALRLLHQCEKLLATPMARVIRAASVAATSLGALHSYSGATTFSTVPATPVQGKVGEELDIAFTVTGTPEAVQSWGVSGEVPPGMTIPDLEGTTLNKRTGAITGTPTESGSYEVLVQPWDRLNQTGDTNGTSFSIIVEIAPLDSVFRADPPSPAQAVVGFPFELRFSIEGFEAASWRVLGELPEGLGISGPEMAALEGDVLNANSGKVVGTPTIAGVYEITLQPYSDPDLAGDTDGVAHPLTISVGLPPPVPEVQRISWDGTSVSADVRVVPETIYSVRFSSDLSTWETVAVEAIPGESDTSFTVPTARTLEGLELGTRAGYYQVVARPQ